MPRTSDHSFPENLMKALFLRALAPCLAFFLCAAAGAQTPAAPLQIDDAWLRASVPGQSGTGAFMRLTAREPLTLVAVRTPAAGVAEIHEMKLEGDVMRMRSIAQLPLPAGQSVELRPGGHHLMLMNLKTPLAAGSRVNLEIDTVARYVERMLSVDASLAPTLKAHP